MGNLEMENTISEMKNLSGWLKISWTAMKKSSVNLKIGQQKISKLKDKEKKSKRLEQSVQYLSNIVK